jgi:uncharacterized spore protein YtfJ
MEACENLIKASMSEIERLLSTKTVVGVPMTVEGNTVIPLVSISFGFGAGCGSGKEEAVKGQGTGGGGGGGGGIKPTAVIIVDKEGVRVAPIVGGAATAVERFGEAVGKAFEKPEEKEKED